MLKRTDFLRNGIILSLFLTFSLVSVSRAQDSTDLKRFFPDIAITQNYDPSPGYFFIATKKHFVDTVNYFTIIDNYGTPVYFRLVNDMAAGIRVLDGYIYMLEGPEKVYFKIDSMFHKIDTFKTVGYRLDGHDFALDKNGHALMMGRKLRTVDMTQYGGPVDATIKDLVLQEFDTAGNLLYTWKAWEHFQITDANENSPYVDLTASTVDYLHANSVTFDSDTSFLLSCRHFDEITKIDRRTGDIIWRLGGKHNDFTFTNDTVHFSHPHTVRKLPNGNIMIFDNGNLHQPQITSVVEYQLDEKNKTATLVRRQKHVPDIFANHGGGEQMLPGGDLLVYWGPATPSFTEYHPDGSVAVEMDYSTHSFASRVAKSTWKHKVFVTAADTINFGMWDGYTESDYLLTLHNNTDSILRITGYLTRTDNFRVTDNFPVEIPAHGDKDITVAYFPENATTGYIQDVLTIQSEYPHLYLAQQVVLLGKKEDNDPPSVTILPDSAHVPQDAVVTVTFSEPVRLKGGEELNYMNVDTLFSFMSNGGYGDPVPYNASVTTDKMHIILSPKDSLAVDETYLVALGDVLEDYSGNAAAATSVKFSTGTEISAVKELTGHNYLIWPNPGTGRFMLDLQDESPKKITVYTVTGQVSLVKEQVRESTYPLDLSSLDPGIYLIAIEPEGAGKPAEVLKVILQR